MNKRAVEQNLEALTGGRLSSSCCVAYGGEPGHRGESWASAAIDRSASPGCLRTHSGTV